MKRVTSSGTEQKHSEDSYRDGSSNDKDKPFYTRNWSNR